MNLKGIIVPIILPIDNDEIDYDSLEKLVTYLLEKEVDGLFIHGTAGEGNLLTQEQRLSVAERIISQVNQKVPVLGNISDTSTNRVKENIVLYNNLNFDAYVCTLPFYGKTNTDEQYHFFKELCKFSERSIFLYNIPSFVNIEISLDVIKKLITEGLIAGIKESSSDVLRYRKLSQFKKIDKNIKLFTGDPKLIDVALYLGFDGAVVSLGNLLPKICKQLLIEWDNGNVDRVKSIQNEIIDLNEKMMNISENKASSSIPVIKLLLRDIKILNTSNQVHPFYYREPENLERVHNLVTELNKKDHI